MLKYLLLGLIAYLLFESTIQEVANTSLNTSTKVDFPKPIIKDYLREKISHTSRDGGRAFCAYHIFDTEQIQNTQKFKTYLWSWCREYVLENNKFVAAAGSSFPVVVTLQKNQQSYQVISHDSPRDGGLYSEDVRKMFPSTVRDKIFGFHNANPENNQIKNTLVNEVEGDAKIYFKFSKVSK